jgi:hypothetical protein
VLIPKHDLEKLEECEKDAAAARPKRARGSR